jgi:tetratricopeptide (TPR) repeat protein
MRRALAIDEASLGPDHPKVAIRLNNLGQLLQATGRLAEAEPLYRRALAIDEAAFGPDHPDVAIDLNSLGQVLQATNRLAEAEPLVRRVVEIFAKSFGPGHPNVASALHNLAQLLQATNRLAEAEPLMRRVVEIIFRFRAATGHGHPHERAFIATYAGVLAQMGRSGEDVLAQLNAVGAPFGIRLGG